MSLLPVKFQLGFRLFRGEDMNNISNAANAATVSSQVSQSANVTVGAGTLTAAQLLSGLIVRSGSVAAFTDTTDTGAAIDLALGNAAINGANVTIQIKNTTAFAETIAGGTGVTVSGRAVIASNAVGTFLLTRTATATYTLFGIDVSAQDINGVSSFVATPDNGTTQTLTAAMIVGGDSFTSHLSTGGATPSLTLPLGTAMDTALLDMRAGQAYVLRVINTNSGTATIVTNTGWTLTGTLTLAGGTAPAGSWRDFVITKTGTGTYTGVSVGTGTTS